jgi:hypothetical protein
MENKNESTLNNFLSDDIEKEFEEKVKEDKKKYVKSDFTIIERVDKIIIAENGKQLLRERY